MSGQVPVRPSSARQSTSQYIPKKEQKQYRKKQAYAARKNYKSAPVYTRAGVRKAAPPKMALKVSDCAMRYMATIANPFQAEPGACVPCDLFPLPSQKIRAFTRGTFSLGTTGFGFIMTGPCAANDGVGASFTTAASVQTSITAVGNVTNQASVQFTQLPYTTAQLAVAGAVQARSVACGMRVRYAGAESTRSGTVVCYEDQDHIGATTLQATYLSTQQYPSATVARPSGDGTWDGTVCSSGPTAPVELEFNNSVYPSAASGSQTISGAGYLLIMIKGQPGDSYDFEIFQHLEFIGSAVTAKTPSHADTDQYGKIIQSAKEIANVRPLTPEQAPNLFERFAQKVSDSLPQLMSAGVGVARALAGDPSGYAQLLGGAVSMITNAPSDQQRLLRGESQLMKQITA